MLIPQPYQHRDQTKDIPLEELLNDYIDMLIRRGIEISDPKDYLTHILPHGGKLPPLVSKQIALVGDAASMINPLSGEGIVYGLRASEILAKNTITALSMGSEIEKSLVNYERQFRREFANHLRSNFIAHRLLRSKRWAKFVLGGASENPKICEMAVDFMFGDGTLTVKNTLHVIRAGTIYSYENR